METIMTQAERIAYEAGYNAGLTDAAQIAAPDYHKENPGSWAKLRIRLANEIRACKFEKPEA